MNNTALSVVSLAGLSGFLDDTQQAAVAALAGMDVGAPRTLAETTTLLGQDPETLFYEMALAWRAVLNGLTHPDPHALRLQGAHFVEAVSEDVTHQGLYSLHGIVPALRAREFPTQRAFTLTTLWTGGKTGQTVPAGVRIKDPHNEVLLQAENTIQFPGVGGIFVLSFDLTVEFSAPGLYPVEVWLIGAPAHAFYLPVYQWTEDNTDA